MSCPNLFASTHLADEETTLFKLETLYPTPLLCEVQNGMIALSEKS